MDSCASEPNLYLQPSILPMSKPNQYSSLFQFPIVLVAAIVAQLFCGCDLGTYGKRLAESPKEAMPTDSNKTDSDSSEGGGKQEPAKKAEPEVAGFWELDAGASVDAGSSKLKDATISFDFKADGTYVSDVDALDVLAECEGTWKLNGTKVSISQTHVDQEPETESMSGEIDGNTMRIKHGTLTYVLNR